MIASALSKALSQLSDPRFLRVVLIGVGVSLIALLLSYVLVFWGIGWLIGDGITVPFLGHIAWVDDVASWASVVLMMGLSVFLMVPIAQAVQSVFFDEVADAVEARHYPHLPAAKHVPFWDALADGLQAVLVLIFANIIALMVYFAIPPLAPFVFYGLNGFLLGREYFQVSALRREGRAGALALRRRHITVIWITGVAMAVPLTIPVVNLFIPVLGVAAFTHLYHGVSGPR